MLSTHVFMRSTVEPVQRARDRIGAAVERLVEALRFGVVDDDLALVLALGAAQAHPPRVVLDRVPLDRVDEVGAAGGTELEAAGVGGVGAALHRAASICAAERRSHPGTSRASVW